MKFARTISLLSFLTAANALADRRPLPELIKLPANPETFCKGLVNVLTITSQDINGETEYLCPGGNPSTLLRNLVHNPYDGDRGTDVSQLLVQQENQNSRVIVAFANRIPLKPSKAVLIEEKNSVVPYKSKSQYLELTTAFGPPPRNNNDADTVFTLRVHAKVRSPKVNFDDSVEEFLKFYRMHTNNFDYFFAARTLIEPSKITLVSNTIRGYMPDPSNPNATIAISVFNFLRETPDGQHEALVNELIEFSRWSMTHFYN